MAASTLRQRNVIWGGILNPGIAPPNEFCSDFMGPSGVVYRPNYTVLRKCRGPDGEFVNVHCSIIRSSLNKPLFQCSYEDVKLLARTCSKVSNDILNKLGQSGKRWSGTEFFGFYREDVVLAISAIQREEQFAHEEVPQDDEDVVVEGGNRNGYFIEAEFVCGMASFSGVYTSVFVNTGV